MSIRSFELEKRLKATPSSSQNSVQGSSVAAQGLRVASCSGARLQKEGSGRRGRPALLYRQAAARCGAVLNVMLKVSTLATKGKPFKVCE